MERSVEDRWPHGPFIPPWENVDAREQRVVLCGVSWAQYVALADAREEGKAPHLAFLDGELEVLMPGDRHELIKTFLARLLELYAFEAKIRIIGYGSTTRRNPRRHAAAEADESYLVGARKRLLVCEVVQTHGGIDKLEVYRRLGADEVWFWIDGEIAVYSLVGGDYQLRRRSGVFPKLDLRMLERIINSTADDDQDDAVRAFVRSLRRRSRPAPRAKR
ncbi:MAG: Uma2 family endonuclease [Kofleriaceae bacterium]|nr:Uma2 family endonuclease [Kofleriaceae bacterium]